MSSNQSSHRSSAHRSSSHRSSSTSSIRSKPPTPPTPYTSQSKTIGSDNFLFGFLLGSIMHRPRTTHHIETKVIKKSVYYQSTDNSNNQNNNIEEPKYKAKYLDCDDLLKDMNQLYINILILGLRNNIQFVWRNQENFNNLFIKKSNSLSKFTICSRFSK